MFLLQAGDPVTSLLQEWAVLVLNHLIASPLGSLFTIVGFALIIFSQINVTASKIFGYEHRGNGLVIMLMGFFTLALGLSMIFYNNYRTQSYVPNLLNSEDSIQSAYISVLAKELYSQPKEMEGHYENILRQLENLEGEDESDVKYFKAKIAYLYASTLRKNKKYSRASEFFTIAFVLYESNKTVFDQKSLSDTIRFKDDFRFDDNKAYDALYGSAYSNMLRANTFRNKNSQIEFLHKAKAQIDKILEENLNGDASFRARVWLSKGEIHEKMGISGHEKFYVYSYLNDNAYEPAVEQMRRLDAFDVAGELKFTVEEIDTLISSSPVPVFTAVGGSDFIEVPEADMSVSQEKLTSNPFFSSIFPLNRCGDSKPLDSLAYPWKLNPVYVLYPENRLLEIQANYCTDAFYSKKENKIQVASFNNPEKGHYFDEFLKTELGAELVETGAAHFYCTANSRNPFILLPGQSLEEACINEILNG